MIKLLGKSFKAMLAIVAFIVIILGPVCGYFSAYNLIAENKIEVSNPTVFCIINAVIGLVVAFALDVLFFGVIAQILDMKSDIERIRKHLEND